MTFPLPSLGTSLEELQRQLMTPFQQDALKFLERIAIAAEEQTALLKAEFERQEKERRDAERRMMAKRMRSE